VGLSKAPLPSGAAAGAAAAGRASPLVSNSPEASHMRNCVSNCLVLLLAAFPIYMPDQRAIQWIILLQPDDFAEKRAEPSILTA